MTLEEQTVQNFKAMIAEISVADVEQEYGRRGDLGELNFLSLIDQILAIQF